MRKLLQIDSCIGIGSTGRIAENIAKYAQSKGWDCYMAHGSRYIGRSVQHSVKIGSKWDEYLHYAYSLLFDIQGLGSCKATAAFIETIKQIEPDVILMHNIHGYYLNYKILFQYLRNAKIPVIWVQHDCWAFTGHCVHFTAVNCNKWKSGCYKCPRKSSYPSSLFIDNSRLNYQMKKNLFTSIDNMTIVCVSVWLAEVVKKSFLGQYPIKVIENGVDTRLFKPRLDSVDRIKEKYGLNNKFIVLGVATGWSRDNGFYDFLELRKLLDKDFEIVLVGVTESQKAKLPNGITGILRTDSIDELSEIYTSADIFINGSFEETFGLVTVEAMSCGTPVIVFNSTACPNVVDERTGFVVPVKDIKAIASIIYEYRLNPNKKRFFESCRNRAVTRYDQNRQSKEFFDLIENVVL